MIATMMAVLAVQPCTLPPALAAWIDIVRDGKALPAAAHGHGDPCTGIAKMVDYMLVPGKYVLQLSGATARSAKVLIARMP